MKGYKRHKWDRPQSKIGAVCIRCGVQRLAVHKRFNSYEFEYLDRNGIHIGLKVPDCKKH